MVSANLSGMEAFAFVEGSPILPGFPAQTDNQPLPSGVTYIIDALSSVKSTDTGGREALLPIFALLHTPWVTYVPQFPLPQNRDNNSSVLLRKLSGAKEKLIKVKHTDRVTWHTESWCKHSLCTVTLQVHVALLLFYHFPKCYFRL